ncbi:MAG: hypothetical protein H5T74_07970 [Actinobacteria bacterium]|nr:hypothetical protein [Actinomycetota bacterium]
MPEAGKRDKVLFIAYEFPPMGGITSVWATKHVKYLRAHGWEPVVVTVRDAPTSIPDRSLERDIPRDVAVYRTFSLEPTRLIRLARRLKSALSRSKADGQGGRIIYSYTGLPLPLLAKLKALFVPDEKVGWFPFALAAALKAVRKHDPLAIFTTTPPYTTNLVGMACSALTGLPWACEFQDIWIDNPQEMPQGDINRRLLMFLERMMLRRAGAVICAMPWQMRWFEESLGPAAAGKCRLITYGFDPDDFEGEVALEERFTITFTGKLYRDRYPAALLRALEDLIEKGRVGEDEIRLRYIGPLDVDSHRAFAQEKLGSLIEVSGYVDHDECLKLMRSSHLLLLQLAEGDMSRKIYTGKMFEYFGARRPILALVGEGVTKELIEELGAGVAVDPGDVEGIGEAILDFIRRFRAGDELWVDSSRLEEFNRARQAGELAAVLDGLTRR